MREDLRLMGEQIVQTRVALCLGCRHAKGTACGVDGHSIPMHARSVGCPRGVHPDERGHVVWMGVRWVGVPWIVRVWRWSEARDERWLGVPGCGCVVVVKRAWLKMKGWGVAWGKRASVLAENERTSAKKGRGAGVCGGGVCASRASV